MIEFEGIPSGDGESFCWDVDRETFIKIKGEEPEVYDCAYGEWVDEEDTVVFKPASDLYKIYPNDIFSGKEKIKIKIEIE